MGSSEAVLEALERCSSQAEERALTLGETLDSLDRAGFAVTALILCVPFLQPISTGPLSTIGGGAIAALGYQLLRGRHSPWLPERLLKVPLSPPVWRQILRVTRFLMRFFGKFCRRRKAHWVTGDRGSKIVGALFIISGLLVAIPLPGLPLNNTIPSLIAVSAAIGELEEDGYMVFAALAFLVATIVYFSLLFGTLWIAAASAYHLAFS